MSTKQEMTLMQCNREISKLGEYSLMVADSSPTDEALKRPSVSTLALFSVALPIGMPLYVTAGLLR